MSLAEKMETLAVDVRAVSEEDADLALEMARGIREEAAAAHAEALRVAEMERRVAAREAEEREAQAAARESARRADEERRRLADESIRAEILAARPKPSFWTSLTRSSSSRRLAEERALAEAAAASPSAAPPPPSGPSPEFLAKRAAAAAAAERCERRFDLDALPDEVAGAVLRHMGDYEVAATSCTNKRFNQLAATDDGLWGGLQRRARRHPAWRVEGSWRKAFLAGARVDAQWRRSQFARKEHRAHSEYAQCVAMRGDVGVSGSADHDLAVVGLPPRGRPDAPPESAAGWERVLAKCVGHDAPVTCCRLLGTRDGDGDGGPPTTLISGTREGEVRVWDLRRARTDPWAYSEDDDGGGIARVPCAAVKSLTTPSTGQPHSQFFDVGGDGADGLLACAGDAPGAGVHVYDVERWGAAVCRAPGFDASVYGVAWGGGRLDARVVHAACSDGIVRRWDARSPSRADEVASVGRGVASSGRGGGSDSGPGPGSGSVPGPNDATTGHSRGVAARCVAADGDLFAFGSARGTVHVHDARKPSEALATRRSHADCVNCVAMDAELRRVVTGGDDCGISVMRLPVTLEDATPSWVSTPLGVLSVAFDHSRMIAGCEDTAVRVWDAVLGEGYVDGDALKAAMRELNRRLQGAGSILQRSRGGEGE